MIKCQKIFESFSRKNRSVVGQAEGTFQHQPVKVRSCPIFYLLVPCLLGAKQGKPRQIFYGDFLFLEELEMVEGFDEQTIAIVWRAFGVLGQP